MRRNGNGPRAKATGIAAAAALLFVSVSAGFSASFDAVVPKEIQVDTAGPAFGVKFFYWGWIVATADSLTDLDLSTAVITSELDNDAVTVDLGPFDNVETVAPLRAGEAAGLRLDPWNSVMDTLLQAGEALKAPDTGFFTAEITFPDSTTDTVLVTSSITMAGEELTYTTTVIFGELGLLLPKVVEGQRVASVPVTVPVETASWGSLKARFLPSRRDPR